MIKKILITLILQSLAVTSICQKKIVLNGYLNDMQSVYYIDGPGWLWENQLHNRLKINMYPYEWLKFTLHGRTRFIQGNTYSSFPGYGAMMGKDGGWLDLTCSRDGAYNNDLGYIFSTTIDRGFAEFTFGNFSATIGRQRINWGQTFVWNPNDIFNAYSYFDVDYPERPGSDAIRLQYYTGITSNIELAVKLDSSDRITAAGYFRFNAMGYDFQILGGLLSDEELVLGTGWSGNILDISFRGEFSYFRNLDNFADSTGNLLVSAGLDYTFSNSLSFRTEFLYSGFARNSEISSFIEILGADMNVKSIGFTEWSIFGSISYPFTPLINFTTAGMYFPEWKGLFFGPSFDVSLSNNLTSSIILQGFSAEIKGFSGNLTRQNTFIGYLRMKWSF
jgi:hypothetical protein